MTPDDQYLTALCIWKEGRGVQPYPTGMHAILNVIVNRVRKHGKTFSQIVMAPWQFSSMTDPDDPQLHLNPLTSHGLDELAWNIAKQLVGSVSIGNLSDVTQGATMYYDDSISFPKSWGNPDRYQATVKIGRLNFFREL